MNEEPYTRQDEEEASAGELRAVYAAMSRRSGLRAEDFHVGDRVRLLPRAQVHAGGHSGTVAGFGLGGVLVALDQLPPVAAPVVVSPDLLEPELRPWKSRPA